MRERMELFETDQRDVVDLSRFTRARQRVKNLPRTQNHPTRLAIVGGEIVGEIVASRAASGAASRAASRAGVVSRVSVRDDCAKPLARSEIVEATDARSVVEQKLGREHHHGFEMRRERLATQRVEILRGGGGIDHHDVRRLVRVFSRAVSHVAIPRVARHVARLATEKFRHVVEHLSRRARVETRRRRRRDRDVRGDELRRGRRCIDTRVGTRDLGTRVLGGERASVFVEELEREVHASSSFCVASLRRRRRRLARLHALAKALEGYPAPLFGFAEGVERPRGVFAISRGSTGEGIRVVVHRGEPSLRSRARMVRALAVVPVRQEEHQARALPPLGLARGDELVDDALRVVGEIAELRLPQHERRRSRVHRVAVLETQDGVFAERRVGHHETILAPEPEVIQRVHRARGSRAVQHGVSMIERASLDVLPRETHVTVRFLVVRLKEQRPERQQFRRRPVHALAAVLGHHRATRAEQFAHVRVRFEIRREQRTRRRETRDRAARVRALALVVAFVREFRDGGAERAEQRQIHARDGGSRIVRRGGETRSTGGQRAEPRGAVLDDELVRRGGGTLIGTLLGTPGPARPPVRPGSRGASPRGDGPIPRVLHVQARPFVLFAEIRLARVPPRSNLILRRVSLRDELRAVQLRDALVPRDGGGGEREGDARVVLFVVSVSAVTHEVDDDVGRPLGPPIRRQATRAHHSLGVVRVDVQDGRAVSLGDVGRVRAGPRAAGDGGEPDLVVHHDVHRAPRGVIRKVLKLHHLRVRAEAAERGVAVQQETRDATLRAAPASAPVRIETKLSASNHARHHRVHRLEMARIRRHREIHRRHRRRHGRRERVVLARDRVAAVEVPGGIFSREVDPDGGVEPEVIPHVPDVVLRSPLASHLRANRRQRFLEDGVEDVQSPAVRHPHHQLFRAVRRERLHHRLQTRNEREAALEAESFRRRKRTTQKRFERLGANQSAEHRAFLLAAQPPPRGAPIVPFHRPAAAPRAAARGVAHEIPRVALELESKPILFLAIRHVVELGGERPAVRRAKTTHDLVQTPPTTSSVRVQAREFAAEIKLTVGAGVVEAEVLPGVDASTAKGESIGETVQETRDVGAVLGDARLHVLVPLDERPAREGREREGRKRGRGSLGLGFRKGEPGAGDGRRRRGVGVVGGDGGRRARGVARRVERGRAARAGVGAHPRLRPRGSRRAERCPRFLMARTTLNILSTSAVSR